MDDSSRFSDPVWDRFFEFICVDVDGLSGADVTMRLEELGIDTEKQKSRVHQALDCRRARKSLEIARSTRVGLLKRAKAALKVAPDALRANVRQMIREKFHGPAQAAYFRKLESASSDHDLVSLLEDLHVLDGFVQEDFDVGSKAK